MLPRARHLLLGSILALAASPAMAGDCLRGFPRYRPAVLDAPRETAYRTPDGRIRIVGYNDMAEMFTPLAELFTRRHPDLRFELVLNGTRTGPPALTDGSSLIAPMGAEWSDDDLAAYRARYGSDPVMIRVAHDSLSPRARSSPTAIVVNAANPLVRLTMEQVRAVFTGTPNLSQWSQLGGWIGGAIHPVGLADNTALGQFLRRKFGNAPFAPSFIGLPQSRQVIAAVAADRQAIGFANLNHVASEVRVVGLADHPGGKPMFGTAKEIRSGRYPFDRHLLVFARRDASGLIEPIAKAWLELLLSCEGQAIIASGNLGYIPLEPREAARERRKLSSTGIRAGFDPIIN